MYDTLFNGDQMASIFIESQHNEKARFDAGKSGRRISIMEKAEKNSNIQTWHRNPTVEAWVKHIEIVLGYQTGESHIGTYDWTVTIHDKLCKGETPFGIKGTNAAEAMLQVIKVHTPNNYSSALLAMKNVILVGRINGEKLKKLGLMWERVSGESLNN